VCICDETNALKASSGFSMGIFFPVGKIGASIYGYVAGSGDNSWRRTKVYQAPRRISGVITNAVGTVPTTDPVPEIVGLSMGPRLVMRLGKGITQFPIPLLAPAGWLWSRPPTPRTGCSPNT
jgi:hypothetical protein